MSNSLVFVERLDWGAVSPLVARSAWLGDRRPDGVDRLTFSGRDTGSVSVRRRCRELIISTLIATRLHQGQRPPLLFPGPITPNQDWPGPHGCRPLLDLLPPDQRQFRVVCMCAGTSSDPTGFVIDVQGQGSLRKYCKPSVIRWTSCFVTAATCTRAEPLDPKFRTAARSFAETCSAPAYRGVSSGRSSSTSLDSRRPDRLAHSGG